MRRILGYTLAAITFITVLACGLGETSDDPSSTLGPGAQGATSSAGAAAPAGDTYTLTVEGKGSADITYGLNVDSSQESGVKLPWSKEVTGSSVFSVSIVAQRKSSDNGEITCTIKRGAEVLKTNKSSGPYVVVTCSGP